MKVLTIREPFASLILNGDKKIETRSWKTSYRGELYIHAGLSKDKVSPIVEEICHDLILKPGFIICKCEIVDCILMDEKFIREVKKNKKEYLVGDYQIGRYAWILKNIERMEPIPAKGKLSIWNYEKH